MASISLKDLSFDILVHIASSCRETFESSRCDWTGGHLRKLSLVCKAFNDASSVFLFHRYHIRMLGTSRRGAGEEAKARISVIARKAPYIRELQIVVNDMMEELMQDLVSAMRCVTGLVDLELTSYTRDGSERRLSEKLISALASGAIKPNVLKISGEWSPPESVETIDKIGELHIQPMTSGNLSLTTFIKVPKLYLQSRGEEIIVPYVPTQRDSRLKHIYIVLADLWWLFAGYNEESRDNDFAEEENRSYHAGDGQEQGEISVERHEVLNFSEVPSVDVNVEVKLCSRYYSDWLVVRGALNKMFADDLRSFNVKYDSNQGSVTIWRTEGEHVTHQDQLVDKKRDAEGLARDEELRENEYADDWDRRHGYVSYSESGRDSDYEEYDIENDSDFWRRAGD